MSFKEVMGILSVAIMAAANATYIWQTTGTDVQPHPFSWFLWGFVTGVVYLVQVHERGGPGTWVVGFTSIICFLIGAISFFRHRSRFTKFDWGALIAGLLVFAFYLASRHPTQSAILATATDVIGYASTIRKGWAEPHKDSVTLFALNSAKFVPSLFALNSYSLATWLYPATLAAVNGLHAAMLLWRRRAPS